MFQPNISKLAVPILLGTLLIGFPASRSFALSNTTVESKEFIPDSLLKFDEPGFDKVISSFHTSPSPVPLNHAWSVLGRQEAPAHLNLGIFYHQNKRYDLAEAEYKRSLTLDPEDPNVHFNLGIVYFDQKKLEDAGREYRQALTLDPSFGIAHNNLGTLYLVKKEYDLAVREFEQALTLDPNDIKARVNLGHIHFYVDKDYLAAQEHYSKVLQLNPTISLARTNLDRIREERREAQDKQKAFEASVTQEGSSDSAFVESFDSPDGEESAPSSLFNF